MLFKLNTSLKTFSPQKNKFCRENEVRFFPLFYIPKKLLQIQFKPYDHI